MPAYYGHYARMLHNCTDQAMNAAMAQMDLTAAQGHILGYLANRQEPCCHRDVEEAFHLSHPTVSGLLCRMERKGFITLCCDPADHRRKLIHVELKGRSCMQTMHETILAIEAQMVQGFTPEEKQLFATFLERAIQNIHPDEEEDP